MIRIAHIADSHFDEHNRLEDNIAVHDAFLEAAAEAKVDLIVHAGDFFERKSSPAERKALTRFLDRASSFAKVCGVRGNHDAEDDLFPFNYMSGGTFVSDRPTVEPGSALDLATWATCGIRVLTLPWFTKAHLVAATSPDVEAASTTRDTIAAARALLTALRAEASRVAAEGGVPILVGHVQVAGSETSTGQTLIGQTVELSPGDLADVGCAYVALGHIHRHQAWGNVVYSGSPQRMNFGEPEEKGWVLVEIDPERWQEPGGVRWEFRPLPARRIVLLEADWSDELSVDKLASVGIDQHCFALSCRDEVRGSLVRFRYRIRSQDLHYVDEAAIRKVFEADGAHSVKLEAVIQHETRARCEEIVSAQSIQEKVVAYWDAKGLYENDPHARARILDKLAMLETPYHVLTAPEVFYVNAEEVTDAAS